MWTSSDGTMFDCWTNKDRNTIWKMKVTVPQMRTVLLKRSSRY